MEPVKDKINFAAVVERVEEKFEKKWKSGFGENAVFEEVSRGWFVVLCGSHESIFSGFGKPHIDKGDMAIVRINFYAKS